MDKEQIDILKKLINDLQVVLDKEEKSLVQAEEKPEEYYSYGNIVLIKDYWGKQEPYIIVTHPSESPGRISFISLEDGNRWSDNPYRVGNVDKITASEIREAIAEYENEVILTHLYAKEYFQDYFTLDKPQ